MAETLIFHPKERQAIADFTVGSARSTGKSISSSRTDAAQPHSFDAGNIAPLSTELAFGGTVIPNEPLSSRTEASEWQRPFAEVPPYSAWPLLISPIIADLQSHTFRFTHRPIHDSFQPFAFQHEDQTAFSQGAFGGFTLDPIAGTASLGAEDLVSLLRLAGHGRIADRLSYLIGLYVDDPDEPEVDINALRSVTNLVMSESIPPEPAIGLAEDGTLGFSWRLPPDGIASIRFDRAGMIRVVLVAPTTLQTIMNEPASGIFEDKEAASRVFAFFDQATAQ